MREGLDAGLLPTFIMLYQERVFDGGQSTESGTHTSSREQSDQLDSHTKTDTRESDDTDISVTQSAFPRATATETFTETRENRDSDISHSGVFETITKTSEKAREQDDQDVRAPFLTLPPAFLTQTFSKDDREHLDQDASTMSGATFPTDDSRQ